MEVCLERAIHRVVNLISDEDQSILNMSVEAARDRLVRNPESLDDVQGSFALVARDGENVLMARSLDRPLRYFLAKQAEGPMLVVADRIDAIRKRLEAEGYGDQFHPTYTRMVPAHHVTTLRLIGCPDPNPSQRRFFNPPRETLPPDLDLIGELYVGALMKETSDWLAAQDGSEPIGVCFSGGIDSGAVLVALERCLRAAGQSPARLKAFTLQVGEGGEDARQALEFLRRTNLEMLGEIVEVEPECLDPLRAVEVIEDYKPLDVECATVGLALLEEVRRRYPSWRLLVDGDGGDENLKDYPIEDNPELTIRSVVNNLMLYHEGWGVDAVKHSLTYSGGLSRGTVRTYAPARTLGFSGFSPFTCPSVVAVAEAITFAALSKGSHEQLYELKGEVVRRGMKRVLDIDFPVFPKRRFQHGVADEGLFERIFSRSPMAYRRHFLELHASS